MKFTLKHKLFFSAFLFFSFLYVVSAYSYFLSAKLRVYFLDVGQGDAIFIETPSKNQILVDAGFGNRILEELSDAMPFWDKSIDLAIMTHPDRDHAQGFLEVLEKYKVENFMSTKIENDSKLLKEIQEKIKSKNINHLVARSSDDFALDKGVVLDVVYPLEGLEGIPFEKTNNSSIVLKLITSNVSFLLTGDIEESKEKEIAESGQDINADVLKVAHHGSRSSSSKDFVEKVSPAISVIQSGVNNKYGHPHQEALERLKNSKILGTYKYGRILIKTDGRNTNIETELPVKSFYATIIKSIQEVLTSLF